MGILNNSTAILRALKTSKFIELFQHGVYDHGKLGKMVESNLIYLLKEQIIQKVGNIEELPEDDNKDEVTRHNDHNIEELDGQVGNIEELPEDDNKDEVTRHNDHNIEELDGQNIPGDACILTTHTDEDMENGNSYKYKDILVKDEETGRVYDAVKLIADKLQDNPRIAMTIKEVGDFIEENKITAPITNNKLSHPYRRNPFYKASKDSIKTRGDMHLGISKNLFDHCHSELNSSRAKFPCGVFRLYTDTRPETATGKCLFRLKNPKVLQLVYYVNDIDKSHPEYLKVQILTMDMQKSGESHKLISLKDAVSQRIVSNQVIAYFIGKIYEFYTFIGMSEKLRFKQQCDAECCDAECWVAEIKCSGGWIECTRIYGKNDAALEAKLDPIDAEEGDLSQTFLVSTFKNNSKKVAEALEAMGEEEKEAMMADIKSKGEYKLYVATLLKMVSIKPNMLPVTKEKKTIYVAAVSFKIEQIVCCLYEHSYNTKPGKKETLLNVFSFPPLVAPYKCFVIKQKEYKTATELTKKSLDKAGIRYLPVDQGKQAWKKQIMSDEMGCPFAVRVNSEDSVTIRERDSNIKISVEVDDVVQLIEDLLNGVCTWVDTCKKYPPVT